MRTRVVFPLLLMLAAGINVYFRLHSILLPSLRETARAQITTEKREELNREITRRQYALPASLRAEMLERELAAVTHARDFRQLVISRERELRDFRLDDDGLPYLLENDSYRWMRRIKNYLQTGSFAKRGSGTNYKGVRHRLLSKLVPDPLFLSDDLMQYPLGHPVEPMRLHYLLGAGFYRLLHAFGPSITLSHALAIMPVVLSVLMVAAVFLLGRTAGLSAPACAVASLIIGLSRTLIERTQLGWYDTDMYNMVLPLLIAALLTRAMNSRPSMPGRAATEAIVILCSAGLLAGIYSGLWSHWWVPVHVITAGAAVYGIAARVSKHVIARRPDESRGGEAIVRPLPLSDTPVHGNAPLVSITVFVIVHLISVIIISGPSAVGRMFWEPFFDVTTRFKATLDGFWPSVASNVGEIRGADAAFFFAETGHVLAFCAGALGLLLLLRHVPVHTRNAQRAAAACLLSVWFVVTLLMTLGARRFMIFLIVPSGIGVAALLDYVMEKLRGGRLPGAAKLCCAAGLYLAAAALPIYNIHSSRFDACVKFNDAWARMTDFIRRELPADAVVISDWPPGDLIMTLGERATVNCAGWQYTPVPYWVARAYAARDEREAAGIMRMLAAGSTKAFDAAERLTGGDKYAALALINRLAGLSKEEGVRVLDEHELQNRTDEESAKKDIIRFMYEPSVPVYVLISANTLTGMRSQLKLSGWDFRRGREGEAGEIAPFSSGSAYSLKGKEYLLFNNGLLISRDDGIPYAVDRDSGEWTRAPLRVVFAWLHEKQGSTETDARSVAGWQLSHTAVVRRTAGGYEAVVMDNSYAGTLFVQLGVLEGKGMKHFTLVHAEDHPNFNERLFLYNVTW